MININTIKPGQKLYIKSYEDCLKQGYLVEVAPNKPFDQFYKVKNNPGFNLDMRQYLGQIVTYLSIAGNSDFIICEETYDWVWPSEVLELLPANKKLKII